MTSPFAQHTTGGAYIKPADLNGHLVIITNVASNWPTEYDTLRKKDVEVASFAFADLNGTEGWVTVRSSYAGINNKLGNIRHQPGMVLGRIGQARTADGFDAWVLAEYSAEDEAYAVQWLAANPAPSAFAAQSTPAPVAQQPAPAGLPPLPTAAAPAAAPVATALPPQAPAAAPAQAAAPAAPQLSPEAIAQMMAALQGQPAGQQ